MAATGLFSDYCRPLNGQRHPLRVPRVLRIYHHTGLSIWWGAGFHDTFGEPPALSVRRRGWQLGRQCEIIFDFYCFVQSFTGECGLSPTCSLRSSNRAVETCRPLNHHRNCPCLEPLGQCFSSRPGQQSCRACRVPLCPLRGLAPLSRAVRP